MGVGCFLLFMVPFACALFPQNVSKGSSLVVVGSTCGIFHKLPVTKQIGASMQTTLSLLMNTPMWMVAETRVFLLWRSNAFAMTLPRLKSPQSTCDKKTPRRIHNCKRSKNYNNQIFTKYSKKIYQNIHNGRKSENHKKYITFHKKYSHWYVSKFSQLQQKWE